jgi:16S rRNA (cytosine967-C5)-methyltransferase
MGGFANALLRRLAASGEPPLEAALDPLARLEIETSTPRWLVRHVVSQLGADEAARALAAWNEPAPTWLRANTLRTTRDALARALADECPRVALHPSPLAPDALAARGGGDLFSTATYARGDFLAQDLGAQLAVRMLEPRPGEVLLDACAGVGGKATYLAALAGNRATIDAADRSARKLELCADHAHRLGVTGLRTIEADLTDANAPLRPAYDRVLLDAPCSGLGVLRRHPEAKWRTAPEDVTALAALQARLLAALAPRVKPGGALVYAVCTFTEPEGPQQVRAFLVEHPDFWIEPWGAAPSALVSVEGELRTWPHRDDADAFYAVRMRRRA